METNYERAHELCNQLGDVDKAFPVLYGLFRYFMLRANYGKSRELAAQLVEIALATQNPSFLVAAHRAMGGPLVYFGEHQAAIQYFSRLLAIEVTPELRDSYHYEVVDPWIVSRSYIAWALWFLGYPDQARKHAEWAIDEAQAFADQTGEGYWRPELSRVRGELLLRRDGAYTPEVEACFQSALKIACEQNAKSLELRAAMSLARQWQKSGRSGEVLELLKPVYDWFQEGFETRDLQDAQRLLSSLKE